MKSFVEEVRSLLVYTEFILVRLWRKVLALRSLLVSYWMKCLNDVILYISGGIICIAMREEYLEYVSEYKGTLGPLMKKLERDGKWKLLSKDTITNYFFGKSGVVFQYENIVWQYYCIHHYILIIASIIMLIILFSKAIEVAKYRS